VLTKKLLTELQEYIKIHLDIIEMDITVVCSEPIFESIENFKEIEDFINDNRNPTFRELLFNLIEQKNTSDPVVYNKAGIDRRHFSKIRSNPNYLPKKNTIIALALALELNKDETVELLNTAGYSLSNSDKSDLVIQFFMERKIYDINMVNEALDQFSLNTLI
jgi:hypothetical protein